MSTPSEEARAEAEALIWSGTVNPYEMHPVDAWKAGYVAGASRVSTPPSEDWEYGLKWGDEDDEPYSDYSEDLDWLLDGYGGMGGDHVVRRRKPGPWEPVPAVPVLPTEPAEER